MKEYKIFLVESIKADIILAKNEIGKVLKKVQINIVNTKTELIDQLKKQTPDLVITAYKLPSLNGLTVMQLTKEKSQHIPVIFLTASLNEKTAVECMKAGATDYITKEHITQLGNAVVAAIKTSTDEHKKMITTDSLISNAEIYHNLFAYNPLPMFVLDIETSNIIEVNNSCLELYGYTRNEFLGLNMKDISPVGETPDSASNSNIQVQFHTSGHWWHVKKTGEIINVEITSHFINFNGKKAMSIQVSDITKRENSLETLKLSENKYRTLFESFQDIYFQTDLQGILYDISPSIDRYLGFSRDELIGNPINDLYYDIYDRDLLIKTLLEKGFVRDFRARFRTRNNEITFASMNAHIIYSSTGQPDLIEGSLRDVTERSVAQEIMRKDEEKFRSIFESTAFVKLIVDLETKQIIDANYAASLFYGYSKERIKQMKIGDITLFGTEELITLYKRIHAAGYMQYETQHRCNDGSLRSVEIFATKIIIAGRDVIYAIVNDITSRKEAELQSWLLNKSIENSPVGIMITDQHGRIEYVNPRFTKITGHNLHDIKEKKHWFLYSGNYSDRTYSEMWETILSGQDWTGELQAKRKNGEQYWEDISISPVKNEMGQITHVVMVFEDITSKHKMRETILSDKDKIEAADRLKLSLINNISNEVRTPLNGIMGFAEMLVNTGISQETKQSYIDIIRKSSARLLNTINSYIDISMILSRKTKVFPKLFNVNTILDEIRNEFKENCTSKDIELVIKKPEVPKDFQLKTDPEILRKIMSHLLCNAVKFTEKGTIDFGFRIINNNPEFFVTSTDSRIESKKITSLFDYTIHSNATASQEDETSRLALPIARGLVELLRGKILVESGKTPGSTIYFILPADIIMKTGSEQTEEEVKPLNTVLAKNSVVLVAEDDDYNYKFVETVLRKAGFRVIRAENGLEAVNICYNNSDIHLVLMDLNMPVMGGIEATRQIKNFLPNLPVIALTAFVSYEAEHEAFLSGCEDYISKPINRSQLLNSIGDLMGNNVN